MNLLLVDASSFIFRAYYALPPLTRRSDGMPVGAVAGFCNMIWNTLRYGPHRDVSALPSHVGIVFDFPAKSFRSDIYPLYKAHRPDRPDDLSCQFPIVREATRAFGFQCLEQRGWEADDLIATYATAARAAGGSVVVLSSDKDLMQLVCDGVVLVDTMRETVIDEGHVRQKFGVDPCQMVDFQALVGDATDNVPGVPKVGVKTAAQLLNQFGSIEAMLADTGRISPPKLRERICSHLTDIFSSQNLVKLRCDVPLDVPLESLAWDGDIQTGPILDFCAKMEFVSLAAKVHKALERAA